jgi:hypothetical protein
MGMEYWRDIAIALAIDGRERVLTGVEDSGTLGLGSGTPENAPPMRTYHSKRIRIHGRLEPELEKWVRRDIGHDFV